MGLSFSIILSAWTEICKHSFYNLINPFGFFKMTNQPRQTVLERSLSFKNWEPQETKLEKSVPLPDLVLDTTKSLEFFQISKPAISAPEPFIFSSPRPICELDAAATTLQKVYKSYRTRRNLADCAVVVEELWWKALDFAALNRSSVSFFQVEKHESAGSRWARASTRAARVGKGLSKDEKARQLALQHWLEAIDPRHRYGHNLHFYYDIWSDSKSTQPFFYWLDVGEGKEVNVPKCPRIKLQRECIRYLGPKEREEFEVIVEDGKLVYRQSGECLNTKEGSKLIFVLSTSRSLYVGQKKKGEFQHSSFLSGGATTAAGRMVVHDGVLEAIWPYSGHYLPTEDNFNEFISFLKERHVDLTNVKRGSMDDDNISKAGCNESEHDKVVVSSTITTTTTTNAHENKDMGIDKTNTEAPVVDLAQCLPCNWTSGVGPRIGCVRDYPSELQFRALEKVNLSPRPNPGLFGTSGPVPSPRPSPKIRLSPRFAYMGLPSPRVRVPSVN